MGKLKWPFKLRKARKSVIEIEPVAEFIDCLRILMAASEKGLIAKSERDAQQAEWDGYDGIYDEKGVRKYAECLLYDDGCNASAHNGQLRYPVMPNEAVDRFERELGRLGYFCYLTVCFPADADGVSYLSAEMSTRFGEEKFTVYIHDGNIVRLGC